MPTFDVVRDEHDNYQVIRVRDGKELSPKFPSEQQGWDWLDFQSDEWWSENSEP